MLCAAHNSRHQCDEKKTGEITFNLHDKLLAYCALNLTGLLLFFPEVLETYSIIYAIVLAQI